MLTKYDGPDKLSKDDVEKVSSHFLCIEDWKTYCVIEEYDAPENPPYPLTRDGNIIVREAGLFRNNIEIMFLQTILKREYQIGKINIPMH